MITLQMYMMESILKAPEELTFYKPKVHEGAEIGIEYTVLQEIEKLTTNEQQIAPKERGKTKCKGKSCTGGMKKEMSVLGVERRGV